MKNSDYELIEAYMNSCMQDSAHDKEHIYRVLYNALEIAKEEKNINYDILITACLLHDIGRKEQFENHTLCHAKVGGEKAYQFLKAHAFENEFALEVKECIQTHRFRKELPPKTIEAKILFDADKLDVAGTIGIARTLLYKGQVNEPIYSLLPNGQISDGSTDESPSFFEEYQYKLKNIYANFLTKRGMTMAKERENGAIAFYQSLYAEINESNKNGKKELEKRLDAEDKVQEIS